MVERRGGLTVLSHLVLVLGVIIVAFPVYIAFVASTQTSAQIAQSSPISLIPGDHFLETYRVALFGGDTAAGSRIAPAWPMMWVSLVSALVIAIGKISISLLSAFAIVYFRFPFRSVIFWMIFVTLMLPVEVRIGPTYEVVSNLGMLNTYAGLTIPLIASATATFLFRQFFLTVPDELVEAARMDGAGPMRFFWDVLLPLSRTSIAALFVIQLPLAAAGHHQRRHVSGRHGHQTVDFRRRGLHRVERGDGQRAAGDDSAGDRRHPDAEMVRQGPGRF